MNQIPYLIQREFWENRTTFLTLPLVATGFFLLVMLLVYLAASNGSAVIDISLDEDTSWTEHHIDSDDLVAAAVMQLGAASPAEREDGLQKAMHAMGVPLALILWFVVIFYLISSLYADRKDRSILFWKSMPVSDAMTVLSKLAVALLCVPAVYIGLMAVMQLFALILLTFGSFGTEVSAWSAIWAPSALPGVWMNFVGIALFQLFWCLPLYGWIMLVSSHVQSVPLAWVIGVPFGISIVERIVIDEPVFGPWFGQHLVVSNPDDVFIFDFMSEKLFSIDMFSGVVVGAAFIGLAVWRRSKADEL